MSFVEHHSGFVELGIDDVTEGRSKAENEQRHRIDAERYTRVTFLDAHVGAIADSAHAFAQHRDG
ncbi:MAG TPA: hypothetical protein VMZ53_08290 [Kofleriaceae bacterium]|nr:hypothetical protein [Kofleriaceae bacterium]